MQKSKKKWICGRNFGTRKMSGSPGSPRSWPLLSPSSTGWTRIFSRVAEWTIEKRGVYGCLLNVATLKRDEQVNFLRQASPSGDGAEVSS
jgi:hypothetical protein